MNDITSQHELVFRTLPMFVFIAAFSHRMVHGIAMTPHHLPLLVASAVPQRNSKPMSIAVFLARLRLF